MFANSPNLIHRCVRKNRFYQILLSVTTELNWFALKSNRMVHLWWCTRQCAFFPIAKCCKERKKSRGYDAKRGDNFTELTAFTQPCTYKVLLDQNNIFSNLLPTHFVAFTFRIITNWTQQNECYCRRKLLQDTCSVFQITNLFRGFEKWNKFYL